MQKISTDTGLRIGIFLLFALCERVFSICEPTSCEVRLRIDSGWLCGRMRLAEDGTRYASFRGVRYAKPPLGERRFKELETPEPWDHLYDATEERAACPQKDFIYSRLPLQLKGQSEDCIFLNLHVPLTALTKSNNQSTNAGETGVPILVMVHGGGFQAGSGLTDMHGPEYLLRKEVILITFNHRINIFGYLSLKTPKIPGNQALRDIITLLRWVQRNARAFGGNPDNVTLLGHSSGATCAHLVALSLPARGLIHKVILMSGAAIPNYFKITQTHAKAVADRFLSALEINSTDPDYIHERLTKESLVNLMYALNYMQLNSDILEINFVPVVESEFPNVTRVLDEDPLVLITKGRGREYPLIVGFTSDEFNYFKLQMLGADIINRVKTDPSILIPVRLRDLPQGTRLSFANEFKTKYFGGGNTTFEQALINYSDIYYVHPALVVSEWRSFWGAPVYLYQFAYESERNVIKEANWCNYSGVAHVEDLTYLFRMNAILQGYSAHPPKNNDDLMKEWFPTLFVNFVQCGNPTCTKNESQWPPIAPGNLKYQNIMAPNVYHMSNLTAEHQDLLLFYDRIDELIRNVGEQLRGHAGSRD